ncbi:hypothetical protein Sviol_80130 [Streptomyces violascens]|uniref:Uncharacterized protein n=1 Tax=Streptomyces violascens TaxID=67381 RepID=A0ABQ3R276_9ACTN|nr:hypothetical protein Sviol_80130 [Streptomyces violascens]
MVVGLGEQTEEGPLGGHADRGERLGGERLGLDGADPRHAYRPAFTEKAGDVAVVLVDGGASSAVKALLWGIEVPPTVACDRHRSVVQTRVIR